MKSFRIIMSALLVGTTTVAAITQSTPINVENSIAKYASANLTKGYSNAQVIIDNDESFRQKIEMIRSAKSSIDMAYYIYAQDQSASVFTKEVIKAAQNGIKVRLILDMFMNYKNMDLVNAMVREGRGNIQISLYGRPTPAIIKDTIYMTTPCPNTLATKKCEIVTTALSKEPQDPDSKKHEYEELKKTPAGQALILQQRLCDAEADKMCTAEKEDTVKKQLAQFINVEHADLRKTVPPVNIPGLPFQLNAGLVLSGMYAKNPNFMGVVLAATQALDRDGIIRWAKGLNNANDKAKIKNFLRLYFQYMAGDSMGIKLYFAAKNDVNVMQPIFAKMGRYLPVGGPDLSLSDNVNIKAQEKKERTRDWDYVSDYLHHKILMVDGKRAMVGGRNIENSYHMAVNDEKYVFMDTEMAVNLDESTTGKAMVNAYNRLFTYGDMVISSYDLNHLMPIDAMSNFSAAAEACGTKLGTDKAILAAKNGLKTEPIINKKGKVKGLKFIAQDGHVLSEAEAFKIKDKNPANDIASGVPASLLITDEEGVACAVQWLTTPGNFKTTNDRIAGILENMNKEAARYEQNVGRHISNGERVEFVPVSTYAQAKAEHNLVTNALERLSKEDPSFTAKNGAFPVSSGMAAGYLENLPFSRWKKDPKTGKEIPGDAIPARNFGAKYAEEQLSGKGIHKLWVDELLNICQDKSNPNTEVTLHSAYWFPSSDLLMALGKMARIFPDSNAVDEQGGLPITDCSHVTVKIVTNSVESTDLAPVNMYASYAMYSFYQALEAKLKAEQAAIAATKDQNRKNALIAESKKRAKIEYYQYTTQPQFIKLIMDGKEEIVKQGFSLHTKLSLIGNNVIVGSANGDIRSFAMDTNNAFIIRGDAQFAKQYKKFIDALQKPYLGTFSKGLDEKGNVTDDEDKVVSIVTEQKPTVDIVRIDDKFFRVISPEQLNGSTLAAIKENRFVKQFYIDKQLAKIAAAPVDEATKDALRKKFDVKLNGQIGMILSYLDGVREKVLVMLALMVEPNLQTQGNQPAEIPQVYRDLNKTSLRESGGKNPDGTTRMVPLDEKSLKEIIERAKEAYDNSYKVI